MEIADLLTGPEAVLASAKATGKKALLAELASRASGLFNVDERKLFDRLLERERLGSTGIGGGIAIPHGRLASMVKPLGLFARMANPVDFDAIDERPVDIVFLLVTPEGAGADQRRDQQHDHQREHGALGTAGSADRQHAALQAGLRVGGRLAVTVERPADSRQS